jgi:hypothetical protein
MNALQHDTPHAAYELRFHAGSDLDPVFSFPCDIEGHVDMDRLGDRARNDYLFARAVMKLRSESVAPAVVRNVRQAA